MQLTIPFVSLQAVKYNPDECLINSHITLNTAFSHPSSIYVTVKFLG